jgi:hypothetical protein
MLLALMRKVLVNRAGQEQYDNNRRCNPDGSVEVRVAFKYIEEIGAWIYGCGAAAQDFGGVDVEGLSVEGECPEEVFARAGGGGCGGLREEGGVGLDFCAAGGSRLEV